MKHYIIAALLLPGTLALFQGCKRQAPDDAAKAQNDAPAESKTESGVEMVQLPGGRFTMGDERGFYQFVLYRQASSDSRAIPEIDGRKSFPLEGRQESCGANTLVRRCKILQCPF